MTSEMKVLLVIIIALIADVSLFALYWSSHVTTKSESVIFNGARLLVPAR